MKQNEKAEQACKGFKENWEFIAIVILVTALLVVTCLMFKGKGDYEFLRDLATGLLALIATVALLRRAAALDKTAKAQNKTAVAQDETAKAQNETAKAQRETSKATLQSNQQTIFKDGIKFLGDESESVRLAGIYNLHELAINHPERSNDVLEILCAHLRSKTNEEDYQKKYNEEKDKEKKDPPWKLVHCLDCSPTKNQNCARFVIEMVVENILLTLEEHS